MADMLVVVEVKNGKIKGTSAELIQHASRLAKEMGGCAKALLIGEGVGTVAPEAGVFGATESLVADHAQFKMYSPERFAAVVVDAVIKTGAAAVLATASSMGRDLMPRVAARSNTGMVTEVTGLAVKSGKLIGTRPIYAGKAFVDVEVSGMPKIVTCRPNVFEMPKPDLSKKAQVVQIGSEAASMQTKARITEVIASKSDKPDLTEASVIVSGGRSLKSSENFKILNELAEVLGAAVGASRAAVDAGYAPHSMQVGQTGKTVNPTLYIAAGISGAIQHLAGMRTSKVIVAINSDPEAPIFQLATYGIVGDLFQVVPAMTQELKKLLKE